LARYPKIPPGSSAQRTPDEHKPFVLVNYSPTICLNPPSKVEKSGPVRDRAMEKD